MKIDPTDKLQPLTGTAPVHPKKDDGQGSFSAIFDRKVARKDGPCQGLMPTLSPLAAPSLPPMAEPSAYEKVNGLVDGLDSYRRLLAEPKATLRDLSPLVENMRRQAGDAREMLGDIDEEHPMKAILQETILVITKEVERFNMGTYVAD